MIEARYPDCPECDKIVDNQEESMVLSNFVDWLEQNDYVIARWTEDGDVPLGKSFNALFAEYFGIDLAKAEKERAAIRKYLARVNQERGEYGVKVDMTVDGVEFDPKEEEETE